MSPVPPVHRLARMGIVLALLLAPVLPIAGATPANAATATTPEAPLVLIGPKDADHPGDTPANTLMLKVSPDPRKGVTAGDTVTMEFSGLQPFDQVPHIGMCPTSAPAGAVVTPASCDGRFATGLPGPIDASTGDTPALSTAKLSYPVYPRKDGTLTIKFLVGSGTVNSAGVNFASDKVGGPSINDKTVVCDESHECAIGFLISQSLNDGFSVWPSIKDILIKPKARTQSEAAGCGSLDSSSLNVGGAERAGGEASTWNSGLCNGSGQPLPMNLVGQGEPDGLRSLGDTADLTFAGSGLLDSDAAPGGSEKRVLTPVGVNAVVLAEIGGVEAPSNTTNDQTNRPFSAGTPDRLPSIALSQSDVARILVHDFPAAPAPDSAGATPPTLFTDILSHPQNAAIKAAFNANAMLAKGASLPFGIAPTTVYPVGADSTPALLSAQLHHTSAADLVVPALPLNVADKTNGSVIAPFTDFSSVVDSRGQYTRQTSTVGGIYTSLFGKDVPGPASLPCPSLDQGDPADRHTCARFVVTDLVTAKSLDLPVASIQNKGGDFMPPTPESLQAAVAQGTTNADGLFTPNLDASGAAYPLTFVEYAVSQASPLLNTDCTPRTSTQDALTKVVNYLATGSQTSLTPGLAPLPGSLRDVAKASVAKVGASPTAAGPCAPTMATAAEVGGTGTGTGTGAATAADGTLASGDTSSSFGGADSLGGSSEGFPVAGLDGPLDASALQTPTEQSTAAVAKTANDVSIPVFGRAGALGALGPLAGLVGLVALTSASGVIASKRLAGKTMGDVRTWLHGTFVGSPGVQTVNGPVSS